MDWLALYQDIQLFTVETLNATSRLLYTPASLLTSPQALAGSLSCGSYSVCITHMLTCRQRPCPLKAQDKELLSFHNTLQECRSVLASQLQLEDRI